MKRMLVLSLCVFTTGCDSLKSKENPAKTDMAKCSMFPDSFQKLNFDELAEFDNYIVKFEPGEVSGEKINIAGVEMKKLSDNGTYTFKIKGDEEIKIQAVENIMGTHEVSFIEPDYIIKSTAYNDTFFSQQWSLKNIQAEKAWEISKGASNVIVAVVDSGIDYTHPDLAANIWNNSNEIPNNGIDDDQNGYVDDVRGWNFVSDNNDPKSLSTSNHGTHVAGIIAATANNNEGVAGLSQNVKLMPLKFIGEEGFGSTSSAIAAINYAVKNGAFIINNSWGSTGRSYALEEAIKNAEYRGVLMIAASGNSGQNADTVPIFPAAYSQSNIISVAATTSTDAMASYSNYGSDTVDVGAPGSSIYSTVSNNAYQSLSGTSMAAPMVAGIAALVKAVNQDLNSSTVKQIVLSTVDVLPHLQGRMTSAGRVNAFKAVERALITSSNLPNCP